MTISPIHDYVSSFVGENREELNRYGSVPGLGRYYECHHRLVFDLSEYPDRIIKMDGLTQSEGNKTLTQIGKCAQFIQENRFFRCVVPQVEFVAPNPAKEIPFIWIEEKLIGTYDAQVARYQSEEEYRQFEKKPELKAKWIEIFTQLTHIIVEKGYWDVNWKNILFMGDRVGLVDFEDLSVEHSELGIRSLIEMAPVEAIDAIVEVLREKGCLHLLKSHPICRNEMERRGSHLISSRNVDSSIIALLKEERALALAARTQAHEHHVKNQITDRQAPIAASRYPKESVAYSLVEWFNGERTQRRVLCASSLIEARTLSLYALNIFSKEELNSALEELKKKGDLAGWQIDAGSCPERDYYTLYF